jgi:radical SAM superfamily enzyme YgiQ (UPF0313 family)
MFNGNRIRTYSVPRVIEELKYILNTLDIFELVAIGDDDFFVRPTKEIEDFAIKYKKEIGLPFGIAMSANTYRKEKIEPLLDAGLKLVQMGVQSGSQRVLDEVYNRKISVERTKTVINDMENFIEKYKLNLLLDFIIDSPYETKDDIMKTYNFILTLSEKIQINLFFLTFFPGTPLFDKAVKDGIIKEKDKLSFRFYSSSGLNIRYQKNYETLLILILRKIRSLNISKNIFVHSILIIMGLKFMRILGGLLPDTLYSRLAKRLQ